MLLVNYYKSCDTSLKFPQKSQIANLRVNGGFDPVVLQFGSDEGNLF